MITRGEGGWRFGKMDEGGEEGIYCGDHFVVCMNIELLCCIYRTNIVLHTSFISIKRIPHGGK